MKVTLSMLFSLLSFCCFSQQSKNNNFYSGVFAGYTTDSRPSVGGFGGYKLNDYLGAGIGAEMIGTKYKYSSLTPCFPLFAEIRLTIPGKAITPSLSFQAGKLVFNHTYEIKRSDNTTDFTISAKTFFGGSVIFVFKQKNKKSGFFAGYNFRTAKIEENNTAYNYRDPYTGAITSTPTIHKSKMSSTLNLHIIVIGYTF